MMKSNIIIIILDALRPVDMSLYGRSEKFDNKLKQIAAESVVFNNNFSASNGSDPSITSLFSGQYPTTTGFIHQHPFMRDEEINKLRKNKFWLPLYLQKRGYDTISATPLHLWFKKGFNYYTDKESLKNARFLDSPFIKKILLGLPNWTYRFGKRMVKWRASPQFYPSNKIVDVAIKKIKETSGSFFLFAHFVDTHYPYQIAKLRKIRGKKTLSNILKDIKSARQREYIKKRFYDLSATCLEQIEKKRDDSIAAVDEQIWRLYLFLKKMKLWENTIFMILSDHGDNFGEHDNYFCRGGLFDSSVHVPLIMHLPGVKHKVIKNLTQTIDIVPTILKFIGEKKAKIDGKSLIHLIKTNKKVREKVFFTDSFCEKSFALRTSSRKLVISAPGKCYLCGATHHKKEKEEYNLIKDPYETTNVYTDKSKLEDSLPF